VHDIAWLAERDAFPHLTALAEGVAIREQRRQTSKSRRLYISSKPLSAAEVLATTPTHWSIENQLH
jgi:hypothetical protein